MRAASGAWVASRSWSAASKRSRGCSGPGVFRAGTAWRLHAGPHTFIGATGGISRLSVAQWRAAGDDVGGASASVARALEVTMQGIVLGPGEGTTYAARGSVMTFKALAGDTGTAFSFMEREMPPGGR